MGLWRCVLKNHWIRTMARICAGKHRGNIKIMCCTECWIILKDFGSSDFSFDYFSVADLGCLSQIRIFSSRIPDPGKKDFSPKKLFLMIWDILPASRIRIFFHPGSWIQG
jgi:hypothetical protein